jgi:hypothetical protein
MKKYITIFLLLIAIEGQCQYNDIPLKEHYDHLFGKFQCCNSAGTCYSGVVNYITYSQGPLGSVYGDNFGPLTESLIRMYLLTRDKAYLIKFMNMSIKALDERITYGLSPYNLGHYAHISNPYPGWAQSEPSTTHYQDGLAVWPMAHFVYLILVQEFNELYYFDITQGLLSNSPQGIQTYGQFAEWLRLKIQETIDPHIYYYWDDSKGFIQNPITAPSSVDKNPASLNMQCSWALSILYLGKVYNNSWLTKAKRIVDLWMVNQISFMDRCYGTCLNPFEATINVFNLYGDNAYWWYSNGWRVTKPSCLCNINSTDYESYVHVIGVEDASHATTDLFFMMAAHELGLTSTIGLPFIIDAEMIRFRNTFVKNIYNNSLSTPTNAVFKNLVDGNNQNGSVPPEADCSNATGNYSDGNCYKREMTAFMPLYLHDNADASAYTPPSVYIILMDLYKNEILTNVGNMHGGGVSFYGLGEVTRAQWDKECFDLNLYNRELVYNQNFYAKHNLTINPLQVDNYHNLNDESFAEPLINTNKFIIEQGVNSSISAGNSVSLKGEVHFKSGSEVEIKTIQNICFTGGRFANNLNENYINNNSENTTPMDIVFVKEKQINSDVSNNTIEEKKEDFMSIVSNTNSIVVKSISPIKDIFIYSISGMLVQTFTNINESQKEINLSNFSSGLYVIKAQNTSEIKTQKVNFLRN